MRAAGLAVLALGLAACTAPGPAPVVERGPARVSPAPSRAEPQRTTPQIAPSHSTSTNHCSAGSSGGGRLAFATVSATVLCAASTASQICRTAGEVGSVSARSSLSR